MKPMVQRAALAKIENLKRKMQIRTLSKAFCCMLSESNYVFSMDNLEKMFESYLEKVDGITKEYDLGNEIYLKFRREIAELIYDEAMRRNESEWAGYFWEKYGL